MVFLFMMIAEMQVILAETYECCTPTIYCELVRRRILLRYPHSIRLNEWRRQIEDRCQTCKYNSPRVRLFLSQTKREH
ncbi:hypothetical protein B0H34DRAFT_692241 [Crassisporium funariophilum]|nr:hypothetical protein B0H34DRAFT_692241 [Crassisporium funariophilum]